MAVAQDPVRELATEFTAKCEQVMLAFNDAVNLPPETVNNLTVAHGLAKRYLQGEATVHEFVTAYCQYLGYDPWDGWEHVSDVLDRVADHLLDLTRETA